MTRISCRGAVDRRRLRVSAARYRGRLPDQERWWRQAPRSHGARTGRWSAGVRATGATAWPDPAV